MRSLLYASVLCALPGFLAAQHVTIARDTPLRIALNEQLRLRHPGDIVRGHLTAPVYVGERLAIAAGTPVFGHIERLKSVTNAQRAAAMWRGDFTALKTADIRFDQLTLADGTVLHIASAEAERSGEPLRMSSASIKRSRVKEVEAAIRARKDELMSSLKKETKLRRLRHRAILSLPYHPQWIDPGTLYDAVLLAPLDVKLAPQAAAERSTVAWPKSSTLHARLTATVSSRGNHPGDAVRAVVTEPLFDSEGKIIVPEGTLLRGEVQRATRARWFGRSGKLRFRFTALEIPGVASGPRQMAGQLVGAEGEPRLRLDAEGGSEAFPARNRFLAPLALGILASSSADREHGSSSGGQGAVAGGFGIAGRLLSLGIRSTPASAVFSYYALSQSIYSRWIARGTDVTFSRNTRVEVSFGKR
jgi:hypothetical protein